MNILYLSCHSILEHDEVKLFTELGHKVFSLGSYQNPLAPQDQKRPPIEGFYNDHLQSVAIQCSKENLHQELIDWADVVMVMHRHDWIILNWTKMKHKKVVWRTIGQSIPDLEALLALPRSEGMKIVRYSPEERNIPGYLGEDAVIRFYKNQNEYSCWNGSIPAVMTVAQSMKKRDKFCNFNAFEQTTRGLPRILFGPDNEDTGIAGGLLSYEDLKAAYRNHRVYFYTGTYPASYTLNFIEAMMTGIPVIAIGPKLADIGLYPMQTYEVHKIIKHKENGFCSDDLDELKGNLDYMLQHLEKAREIGEAGRKTACELFGWDVIAKQWKKFFESL